MSTYLQNSHQSPPPILPNNQIPKVRRTEGCFNVQWLCLSIGWLTLVPLFVGAFLPLCSQPRFPSKSYKIGWICNIVCGVVEILLIIVVIAVVASRSKCTYCTDAISGAIIYNLETGKPACC